MGQRCAQRYPYALRYTRLAILQLHCQKLHHAKLRPSATSPTAISFNDTAIVTRSSFGHYLPPKSSYLSDFIVFFFVMSRLTAPWRPCYVQVRQYRLNCSLSLILAAIPYYVVDFRYGLCWSRRAIALIASLATRKPSDKRPLPTVCLPPLDAAHQSTPECLSQRGDM